MGGPATVHIAKNLQVPHHVSCGLGQGPFSQHLSPSQVHKFIHGAGVNRTPFHAGHAGGTGPKGISVDGFLEGSFRSVNPVLNGPHDLTGKKGFAGNGCGTPFVASAARNTGLNIQQLFPGKILDRLSP